LKAFIRFQWPGILWGIFILVLTGVPGNYFPQIVSFWDWLSPDKAVHLFIFGVFTFLVLLAHRKQYPGSRIRYKPVSLVLILGVLYSGLTEVLQSHLFLGRDGNIFDFLANVIGCLTGALLFYLLYRKKGTINHQFVE